MLTTLLGRKVGMTQIFDEKGKVVPVTVVNIAHWLVTQFKKTDNDGYVAVQVGLLRKRYQSQDFSADWLKNKKRYFSYIKEVAVDGEEHELSLGQAISVDHVGWEKGQKLQVTGKSKGLGFQGVVKRWGFSRGPMSHGSTFHRRPGSIGHMTRQGEVIKGKKLPGHYGDKQVTVQGLMLVQADKEAQCLFIKGAIPGKKETVVLIKKQG